MVVSMKAVDLRASADRLVRPAAAILVAAGWVLAAANTRWGVGVGGDGVAYIAGARNLLAGNGLSWIAASGEVRPITIFAPLFPAFLSGLGLTGLDPWQGARWLNVALFGVNAFLVFAVLRRLTREAWLSLVAGALFLFSPTMLGLHSAAISEPLFVCLMLAGLLPFTRYLESGSRRSLLLAAMLAGLAYLTRYAGLFLIGGEVVAIALLSSRPARGRVLDAIIYLVVCCVFVIPWMARNEFVGGASTARIVSPAPISLHLAILVGDIISYWFLPERIPLVWRLSAVLVILFSLAVLWLRPARTSPSGGSASRQKAGILAPPLLIAAYLVGLLVSRAFFVPRISLDDRILSPIHVLALVCVLGAAGEVISQRSAKDRVTRVLAIAVFLLAISYVLRGTIRSLELQADGQGYASRAWRASPLMNALNLLPEETPIYTNEVEALYLLADRRAYRLPTGCPPYDALFLEVAGEDCRSEAYQAWVEAMREAMTSEQAVMAIFESYRNQPYYAAIVPELVEGLDVLSSQGDGWLYVYDRSQWPESPHW